jgi:site-specific recombinase XerD
LNYLDFELEIGAGRGRVYPVFVIHSPGGEAHEFIQFPFDEQQLENQLQALQDALLRSGGKRRKIVSPEEQTIQNFGRALFDALFIGGVQICYVVSQREAFYQGKGLRIKLRIQSPELASLPWEFLYDKRQDAYICLSSNTPIVRYLELSQPSQPLTVTPPLSILGMIANPKDLPQLDIEHEKYRIEKSTEMLRNKGLVNLTWLPGRTWQHLQRAMRNGTWHIFHFIGHGGFDTQADEGLISLEDDEGNARNLTATELRRLLADHRSLRLLVLNSCDGARGSKHDIFSSTAAILLQHSVSAVLAMQYEITDEAAIELSRVFYEALAEGLPVDEAVAEARKAISVETRNTLEWGTPVLYMRSPDGVLFDIPRMKDHHSTNTAIITPTYSPPPIDEQISEWMQIKASNSISTKRTYKSLITNFREVLYKHNLDLNSEDGVAISAIIQEWAGQAVRVTAILPKTYNLRISIIRGFYKFALRQHWMNTNPIEMVEMREDHTFYAAEPLKVEKVKNALDLIPRSTREGKRDYALLCILLTTGGHREEIANLRYGHIAKTENSIAITTWQKGGREMRHMLKKHTAQALLDYLTTVYSSNQWSPDAPIWLSFARNGSRGKAISNQTVSNICRKWLGTPKVEVTNRTYEAIKKEYGDKGIENIENLLGINAVDSIEDKLNSFFSSFEQAKAAWQKQSSSATE